MAVAILLLTGSNVPIFGQQVQKTYDLNLQVTKTENGKVVDETKDIAVEGVANIDGILKEYNILDQFGILQPGESIEIIVRKKRGEETLQDITVELSPMAKLIDDPTVAMKKTPFLGVYHKTLSATQAEEYGLPGIPGDFVVNVIPHTAAAKAGLKQGDIIIGIDDKMVSPQLSVTEIKQGYAAGELAYMHYVRDGKIMSTEIKFGDEIETKPYAVAQLKTPLPVATEEETARNNMPYRQTIAQNVQDKQAFLGVTNDPEASSPKSLGGVMVGRVMRYSTADNMGLKTGDIISDINGKEINSYDELIAAMEAQKPGSIMRIAYIRDGRRHEGAGKIMTMAEHKAARANPPKPQTVPVPTRVVPPQHQAPVHQAYVNNVLADSKLKAEKSAPAQPEGAKESLIAVHISLDEVTEEEAVMLHEGKEGGIGAQGFVEMESLSFYPNPNDGLFNLIFSLPSSAETDIRIIDMQGREIYFEKIADFKGHYEGKIDLRDNAKRGVYFLTVSQGNKAFSKKVVIQ